MKKLFLIPLLTLLTCVMAFAEDRHVTDITGLKAAVADASVETIYLDADINNYKGTATGSEIRILRSVTIDGQGHTIKGYGKRTSTVGNVFSINQGGGSGMVDVVFRNINMIINFPATSNDRLARVIETRGNIRSIELDNVTMGVEDETKTIAVGLQLGGNQASNANITITNSTISVGKSGYPVLSWNPYIMTASNSTFSGYCGLYFKGVSSSAGSAGTIVNADACNFDAPNAHAYADGWNNFGVFTTEDANITINLHNCGMNAQETGFKANQGMILAQREGCVVNISGDNSHINGRMVLEDSKYPGYWLAFFALTGDLSITGGTYSVDPSHYGPYNPYTWFGDQDPTLPDEDVYANFVPDGYEVKEITMDGVATPLYRVVKKAARDGEDKLYDLNDNVQSQGDGQNPTTSFGLSDGSAMTLEQATTKAGYVEVSNATTVTVANNQTLVINNGLDVQGTSVVTANPGSALVIGEGGIVTESSANIVVEANQNGAASLLLDPTITINQTPELTVKMTVPAEHAGYEMLGSDKYRHWFRFAMPVEHMDATWAKEPNVPTFLYGWNYSAQEWAQVGVTEMVPFAGYTLSPDKEISTNTAVTYTFKGQLLGNTNCTLNLNHHGYNFFGNSYTGYISILKLVEQIMGDAKIDGTVWMWDGEKYQGVALEYVRNYGEIPGLVPSWQKEVAPMQTFVLRLTGSEFSSTDINYADAIWGNPRYDNAKSALNAAPARQAEINDNAIISMSISANGQKESIVLIENGVYSDAYDRGYDAIKYMNENSFNTYVGVNGENYGTVATDNLDGKMLSIKTNNELAYSMTFDFVAGEEYALRDNATNQVIAIEEGATYEFAAQPNSTVEGRFEIVSVAKMPTAIENTEVKTNVKGIYTLTGQYVGENFEALPAGVYVVNGVKIVK